MENPIDSKEVTNYAVKLLAFLKANDLVSLKDSLDHFAVKTAGKKEYEKYIEQVLPFCETAQYVEMDGRRIATAKLHNPIYFPAFGYARYIEIMEPKPEKAGKDHVGLEHTEIVVRDLRPIAQMLQNKKVEFEKYEKGYTAAAVVKIGDGLEIKFTNTSLEAVLEDERRDGKLVTIK